MIGMKVFDVKRVAIEFPSFCWIRKPLRDKMKLQFNSEKANEKDKL